jgi:hypothetical protein
MCERLIELKPALNLFFVEEECRIDGLNAMDWKLLDTLIDILQPVEAATRMLSDDKYATLSLVIPMISAMIVKLKKIKVTDDSLKTIKDALIKNITNRFSDTETKKYYTSSTILDPSKYLNFLLIKISIFNLN